MNVPNRRIRMKAKFRRNGIPQITCPECGAGTRVTTAGEVFQKRIPGGIRELLVCRNYPACDCYVAVNRKYGGYGMPANRKVRRLRFKAHRLQEQIVQANIACRDDLYADMGKRYHLRPSRAHIRYFNEEMCNRVIQDYQMVLRYGKRAA